MYSPVFSWCWVFLSAFRCCFLPWCMCFTYSSMIPWPFLVQRRIMQYTSQHLKCNIQVGIFWCPEMIHLKRRSFEREENFPLLNGNVILASYSSLFLKGCLYVWCSPWQDVLQVSGPQCLSRHLDMSFHWLQEFELLELIRAYCCFSRKYCKDKNLKVYSCNLCSSTLILSSSKEMTYSCESPLLTLIPKVEGSWSRREWRCIPQCYGISRGRRIYLSSPTSWWTRRGTHQKPGAPWAMRGPSRRTTSKPCGASSGPPSWTPNSHTHTPSRDMNMFSTRSTTRPSRPIATPSRPTDATTMPTTVLDESTRE